METLIRLVGQYAHWIYAICGFTALYNIYKTWQIRGERRQAIFTLERQKAADDLHKILYTALLLLVVMGITYFSSTVLATAMGLPTPSRSLLDNLGTESEPNLTVGDVVGLPSTEQSGAEIIPGESSDGQESTDNQSADNRENRGENTDTVNNDSNNANVSSPDDNNNGNNSSAQSSDQSAVGRSGNAIPSAAPVSAPECADARASISRPGNGEVLTGAFNIMGTATHEQFQFYDLAYAPGPNAVESFAFLEGGNDPISNSVLATVNPGDILSNGVWTIRLRVVDLMGGFNECSVTITVQN